MLIGVREWLPIWKTQRMIIVARSDAQAALGAWKKERSSNPQINHVVREVSLDLAEGRYRVDVLEHIPGKLNFWADALSRIYMPESPADVPKSLANVPRARPAIRGVGWWLLELGPEELLSPA